MRIRTHHWLIYIDMRRVAHFTINFCSALLSFHQDFFHRTHTRLLSNQRIVSYVFSVVVVVVVIFSRSGIRAHIIVKTHFLVDLTSLRIFLICALYGPKPCRRRRRRHRSFNRPCLIWICHIYTIALAQNSIMCATFTFDIFLAQSFLAFVYRRFA